MTYAEGSRPRASAAVVREKVEGGVPSPHRYHRPPTPRLISRLALSFAFQNLTVFHHALRGNFDCQRGSRARTVATLLHAQHRAFPDHW
ncbi:MAG: hypothetical protein V4773_28060, partial [Verrucomicrobiota bacterium]